MNLEELWQWSSTLTLVWRKFPGQGIVALRIIKVMVFIHITSPRHEVITISNLADFDYTNIKINTKIQIEVHQDSNM